MGSQSFRGELILGIHRFEKITDFFFRCVLPESFPIGQSISGNFHSIGIVRFDFAERIFIVIPDQQRIDCGDKETEMMQRHSDCFVISSGMFHDDFYLTIQRIQLIDQTVQSVRRMRNIKGFDDYVRLRGQNGDRTLTAGNIDTYGKHGCKNLPINRLAMVIHRLPTADSICWG